VIWTFVVLLGGWNVIHYSTRARLRRFSPPATQTGCVPGGQLPHGTGEYYTPPGYYAVAGPPIGSSANSA